jgi:hypothetical protein
MSYVKQKDENRFCEKSAKTKKREARYCMERVIITQYSASRFCVFVSLKFCSTSKMTHSRKEIVTHSRKEIAEIEDDDYYDDINTINTMIKTII